MRGSLTLFLGSVKIGQLNGNPHGDHGEIAGVVLACALAALAPAFVSTPAAGEVKTRVRGDGTIEIFNEGPGGSPATRALRLGPIPVAASSDLIQEHAGRHGVDPRLVQAIAQVESGYNQRAKSRTGAVGLMQLMPAAARTPAGWTTATTPRRTSRAASPTCGR